MSDADLLEVLDAPEIAVHADRPEIKRGDAERLRSDFTVPAYQKPRKYQIGDPSGLTSRLTGWVSSTQKQGTHRGQLAARALAVVLGEPSTKGLSVQGSSTSKIKCLSPPRMSALYHSDVSASIGNRDRQRISRNVSPFRPDRHSRIHESRGLRVGRNGSSNHFVKSIVLLEDKAAAMLSPA